MYFYLENVNCQTCVQQKKKKTKKSSIGLNRKNQTAQLIINGQETYEQNNPGIRIPLSEHKMQSDKKTKKTKMLKFLRFQLHETCNYRSIPIEMKDTEIYYYELINFIWFLVFRFYFLFSSLPVCNRWLCVHLLRK